MREAKDISAFFIGPGEEHALLQLGSAAEFQSDSSFEALTKAPSKERSTSPKRNPKAERLAKRSQSPSALDVPGFGVTSVADDPGNYTPTPPASEPSSPTSEPSSPTSPWNLPISRPDSSVTETVKKELNAM